MVLPEVHAGLEHILGHIIQDFMRSMHRTGLSAPQIHVLLYVYHAGECRLSEIERVSGSSKAAASQLVERLVQQGLVERAEDPRDRRNKRLQLTKKGLGLIRKAIVSNRSLADLMASLTPEQRETVQTAFGYLAEAAGHIRFA